MKFLRASTMASTLVLATAGVTRGQEEGPVAIGGVQILGFSASGDAMNPEMAQKMAEGAASISIGSAGGGFSMGNMLGGVNPNDRSQLFGLLSNASVREELKLTELQYEGVKAVQKASQDNMQKMISSMMANSAGGNRIQLNGGSFKEIMAENQEQAEAALEEILLPPQMERVRQLAYQVEVENEGMGESLINGRLGKEIGVFENQKQSLTDAALKIDAETKAAIAQIKAAARKRLLAELSPDQRKAAEALLGEYFDYEAETLETRMRSRMRSLRQAEQETQDTQKKK